MQKLTKRQTKAIAKSDAPLTHLAEKYNVSLSTIRHWKDKINGPSGRTYLRRSDSSLTDEQIAAIRWDNSTLEAIADRFGITKRYVRVIKSTKGFSSPVRRVAYPKKYDDAFVSKVRTTSGQLKNIAKQFLITEKTISMLRGSKYRRCGKNAPLYSTRWKTDINDRKKIARDKRPIDAIAKDYGIDPGYVSRIKNSGEYGPVDRRIDRNRRSGSRTSPEERKKIARDKRSVNDIAKEYNITPDYVVKIKANTDYGVAAA